MLGATHACANPLTAHYGTTHGVAIALLLPHVVRWNAGAVGPRYGELLALLGEPGLESEAGERLAHRLDELAGVGGLPRTLREEGVAEKDLPLLAQEAEAQWTGRYNPRPFDAGAALELYRLAF
jgi:alcohol dehydrogenase